MSVWGRNLAPSVGEEIATVPSAASASGMEQVKASEAARAWNLRIIILLEMLLSILSTGLEEATESCHSADCKTWYGKSSGFYHPKLYNSFASSLAHGKWNKAVICILKESTVN